MERYTVPMDSEYSELTYTFTVNPGSCKNPAHYQNYLSQSALLDAKQGMGITYLFIEEDKDKRIKNVMGFITLRTSSLIKEMGESSKFGYPALEIAELAVNSVYERQGIGSDMVRYAVSLANELSEKIGIQYIVLCSDSESVGFYSKLGFAKLSSLEELPREHANLNCIPMYQKIKFY